MSVVRFRPGPPRTYLNKRQPMQVGVFVSGTGSPRVRSISGRPWYCSAAAPLAPICGVFGTCEFVENPLFCGRFGAKRPSFSTQAVCRHFIKVLVGAYHALKYFWKINVCSRYTFANNGLLSCKATKQCLASTWISGDASMPWPSLNGTCPDYGLVFSRPRILNRLTTCARLAA